MAKQGRLTLDSMPCNVPANAPLYPQPPFYYRDAETMAFRYETDEEAALEALPDCLELPLPAMVTILIFHVPFGTLGRLHEAVLAVRARWQGEMVNYVVSNMLTSDAAVAAGREIWGAPKKIAHIQLEKKEEGVVGIIERPRGIRICTGIFRAETPSVRAAGPSIPFVTLRILPHPEGNRPLVQLVRSTDPATANWRSFDGWSEWRGTGSVSFDTTSAVDPWHKFKVLQMRNALYSEGPSILELPYGKILKTYEPETASLLTQ